MVAAQFSSLATVLALLWVNGTSNLNVDARLLVLFDSICSFDCLFMKVAAAL